MLKAKELCNIFEGFKPLNDERTEKLSNAVANLRKTLTGVDSETIRDSDAVREKVKSDVDDILSKFTF